MGKKKRIRKFVYFFVLLKYTMAVEYYTIKLADFVHILFLFPA